MRATFLALTLALSGCATIFTGTSQKVTVETNPPGATVIVVGTPMASVLLAGSKSTEVTRTLLAIVGPLVGDETRRRLEVLDFDVLLTRLALWSRDRVPPELGATAQVLPPEIKRRLVEVIGIQDIGPSPLAVKLRKGRKYAVIAWQEGYVVRTAGIDMEFNWVVLVNVFNAFLGVPIDIITGAWFNLSPSRLQLELRPAST